MTIVLDHTIGPARDKEEMAINRHRGGQPSPLGRL